ncbi:MAG: C4-dicarboxylate ABC transporter substrate-binding protein [Epsilonproteobacteria bacterium]|jgi:TRAP transporter TAXI family solute receptor|nr:C4-dicarboxylate ABC transporter substrate-binding protein [Campylobacterota bacterium]NPA89349.1 TAXI family TRAP transporter solute-binding subunit [Campylobacterota bacterium]
MKKLLGGMAFSALLITGSWGYRFLIIGTGGVTGVYYPTGGAICKLLNRYKRETNLKCSVESTEGSLSNLRELKKGELDFGIAQSDIVFQAYHGKGEFKGHPYSSLRVVFSIYPELLTLVVRKDSGIKNLLQLKGHKINIGAPGSGNSEAVKTLFQAIPNLSLSDVKVTQLKSTEAPVALREGKIEGYFYMVGHPADNIRESASAVGIKIIPLDSPGVAKLVKERSYYEWGTIPGGIYKGVDKPVKSYGVKAILVTDAKMEPEVVYRLTKAVLDNFEEFKKMHPAYRHLTKQDLLKGFDLKLLHPGARRAFEEEGLLEKSGKTEK